MTKPLTIGAVLKPGAAEALDALDALIAALPDARILVEATGYHALPEPPTGVELAAPESFQDACDLVTVFGGDGTFIHAATLLHTHAVPILGINLGHIGFITEVARDEFEKALKLAIAGELPIEDRMRLDVQVRRDVNGETEIVGESRVVNDAVIGPKGMARIGRYRVSFRSELVTTIRGDGLIVSTPTGSTAYSMAAGGPLLAPGMAAIAVTPICPHQLSQRPFVLDPSGDLVITVESESAAFATFDGQAGVDLHTGDEMVVRISPVPMRLLTVPWRSYFQTLRTKLKWGNE